MIEIVPYKAEHMIFMLEQGVLECTRVQIDEDAESLAKAREDMLGSRTAMSGGQIIAAAGVEVLWPGVGEMWAMFTQQADECFISVGREARRTLEELIQVNKLHRVQCHVRTDFWRGLRLAQFMGFKEEGLARKYTVNGEDCYAFSIVR